MPQRAIELVGVAVGVGIIAAVALGNQLSNDVFWQMAAGQWMLAHHSIVGLDPFSYTEAHRRWVTDEWGSEVALAGLFRAFGNAAYAIYAIVLGGLCLFTTAASRARLAPDDRVAAIVVVLAIGISGQVAGDRGLDFSLVFLPLELLRADQGARQPALALVPPAVVRGLGQHARIDPHRLDRARLGVRLVPGARASGRPRRRLGQSSHTGPLGLALLGCVAASCVTPYGPGLLVYDVGVSLNGQIGLYIAEWNSPASTPSWCSWPSACRWPSWWSRYGRGG